MAKKAKKRGGGEESEDPPETDQVQSISPNKLKALLKMARSTKNQTQELAGAFGQQVADAKENHFLAGKPFNTLKMIDRMEPEQQLEYWTTLKHYMVISGIQEKIDKVGRLDLGDELGKQKTKDEDNTQKGSKPGTTLRAVAGRDVKEKAGEAAAQ